MKIIATFAFPPLIVFMKRRMLLELLPVVCQMYWSSAVTDMSPALTPLSSPQVLEAASRFMVPDNAQDRSSLQ